jgi:hypothetical protein
MVVWLAGRCSVGLHWYDKDKKRGQMSGRGQKQGENDWSKAYDGDNENRLPEGASASRTENEWLKDLLVEGGTELAQNEAKKTDFSYSEEIWPVDGEKEKTYGSKTAELNLIDERIDLSFVGDIVALKVRVEEP